VAVSGDVAADSGARNGVDSVPNRLSATAMDQRIAAQ
jgi:hypothetical protein